jgi:hypothetical protein
LDVRQTKENQTEEAVQKIAHGRVLIFVPWLLPIKGEGVTPVPAKIHLAEEET